MWAQSSSVRFLATMTRIRREPIFEGSIDGTTWLPYEFHAKPGDPSRAPPFVAPHQPRVDFQLWFLLLGNRPLPAYARQLIHQMVATNRSATDSGPDAGGARARTAAAFLTGGARHR